MEGMQTDVKVMEQSRLEELSSRPNTTVLEVSHEFKHERWSVVRLRRCVDRIYRRVSDELDCSLSDFAVRKACLDEEEILEFQRVHPKLYWLVTDRKLMQDARAREAIEAMMSVVTRVEGGGITQDSEADAEATRAIVQALQGAGSQS